MKRNSFRGVIGLLIMMLVLMPLAGLSQTRIEAPKNKYSIQQDIELGRRAADEVEHKMPVLRDQQATSYLQVVGQRLVDAIPEEFQHPEFRYTFRIIDAKEINAFALPGGPMFVNRGMIEAAHVEGEMAGVMAHELSHVALRHGTAQATKGEGYRAAGAAGAIAGAVIGGGLGSVISQGSQLGAGVYLLKFSREYETQADVLGAQIMARAGYDPRDLANMFKTIQQQGGSGTPQFLSDHPNPENRYQRIDQEAAALHVTNPIRASRDFDSIKERLAFGGPNDRGDYGRDRNSNRRGDSARIGERVELPSTTYRTFSDSRNRYRFNVPDNWRNIQSDGTVWLVPEGAYGDLQGRTVFTHGVNVGTVSAQSQDLRRATDQLISSLQQGNPQLTVNGSYMRSALAGRNALQTSLNNISEVNGRPEVISLRTTMLRNGTLFYLIALAPQESYRDFQPAFQNILRSLQIMD
jgi:Zn-dependent protease with chaperone function